MGDIYQAGIEDVAMVAAIDWAVKRLEELVLACESDFISENTETGDYAEPDDEPVAAGLSLDDKPVASAITFGTVREARRAVEVLKNLRVASPPPTETK